MAKLLGRILLPVIWLAFVPYKYTYVQSLPYCVHSVQIEQEVVLLTLAFRLGCLLRRLTLFVLQFCVLR